jgi:hypothetical protein
VLFLGFLIVKRRRERTGPVLRLLWLPGVLAGSLIVGIVAWTVFYRIEAYESYSAIYDIVEGFLKVDHLHLGDLTGALPQFFLATTDVPFGTSSAIAPWAVLTRYALVGFGLGFLWRRFDDMSVLGSLAVLALVLGGPALAVASYYQFQIANHLPARYALGVFALLGISAAGLPRSRLTTGVLLGLAAALTIGTFSFLA